MEYSTQQILDSIYLIKDGKTISFFHDVPLKNEDGTYNMIVEIPKGTNAKFEINVKKEMNPIIQDIKKGKPRFVPDVSPHKGYPWNYGAFPQTWEDPTRPDSKTGFPGDADPLDVVDVSPEVGTIGQIKKVKILGCLCLLDKDETDWKIIVSDSTDEFDIEIMKNWFRDYKILEGKSENKIGFESTDIEYATSIVEELNQDWVKLMKGVKVSLKNTLLNNKHTIENFLLI